MNDGVSRSVLFAEGIEVVAAPGRFISVAFLGVWLCGWAVGEILATRSLVSTASSMRKAFSASPRSLRELFSLPSGSSTIEGIDAKTSLTQGGRTRGQVVVAGPDASKLAVARALCDVLELKRPEASPGSRAA